MRLTKTNQSEQSSNPRQVLNHLQINEKTPIRDETVIVLNKQQIFNEILVFVSTGFFVFLLSAQRSNFENSQNSRLEKNESKNFFFKTFNQR